MIISCPHCNRGNRLPIERISEGPTCGACKKELLSLPITPNEEAFDELIQGSNTPVIIDFWAPWCGPCKMFTPTFQASAIENWSQIIHVKVDTEMYPALGAKFNVRSIPTLIIIKKSKEIGRISGALQAPQLKQYIARSLQH